MIYSPNKSLALAGHLPLW